MNAARPPTELMMSLNYLFPAALESGDTDDFTGRIATRLQEVISAELDDLGIAHVWDSTCFLHLGTEIIPDSRRCSKCGTWVIPHESWHRTCVVSCGWPVDDDQILCDQCQSLLEEAEISDP